MMIVLNRAEITHKVGHFTLDNASNNGSMMTELTKLLNAKKIPFDGVDKRIMCFPHVINICCQHVITQFTNIELSESAVEYVADEYTYPPSRQTFEQAAKRDPVALARNIVRVIRSSGQRRSALLEVIRDGNAKGYFGKGVKELQLLRDVKTRWDSVYSMISRLRSLRPAVEHFLSLPTNSHLAKYKMTEMEWNVLKEYQSVLECPFSVQQIMSSESMPVLSGSIPAFELFMTHWEGIRDKNDKTSGLVKTGLEWAKTYYDRMDFTQAYIISMLINPSIRLNWIRNHWGAAFFSDAQAKIRAMMVKYHEAAEATSSEHCSAAASAGPLTGLAQRFGVNDMYITDTSDLQTQTIEQEFQSYISGKPTKEKTDIVKFWELNERVFPTLFRIAMDYLPIQASSVPSERIFSSSSETDTRKRNRIHPILMEALQMLKFALKKGRMDFMQGWVADEKDMTETEAEGIDLLIKLLGDNPEEVVDEILAGFGDE